MYQGQNVDIGTPSAGTVGTTQMSYPLANFTSTGIDDNVTSTKFTVSDTGIDVTGTVTADGLAVEGTGSCGTFGNSTDNSSIISLEFNAGADGSGKLMRAGSTYSPAVNYEGWMADSFIIRADDNLSNGLGLFAEHTSGTIRMYTGGAGSSKERMRIDSAGRVTMPYQPSAMVKLNSDYSQCGQYDTVGPLGDLAGAAANIKYETKVYDVGNNYSTSTGRFTCPVAGRYLVTANSNINMSNATGVTFHELYKNGAVYIRAYDAFGYTSNTWFQNSITAVVNCNVDDYIEIKLRCNVGYAWADSDTEYTQASFVLIN